MNPNEIVCPRCRGRGLDIRRAGKATCPRCNGNRRIEKRLVKKALGTQKGKR